MYIERPRQTAESITRRVATYTGIHYPITVTFLIESGLQQGGPGVVSIQTKTGAEAVPNNEDGRARIDRRSRKRAAGKNQKE